MPNLRRGYIGITSPSTVQPTCAMPGCAPNRSLRDDLPEPGGVEEANAPLLRCQQRAVLQPREAAADRFQLEPEKAADIPARHRQFERGSRSTPRPESLREIEQECGQALIGMHGTEQHHGAMTAWDLTAQNLMEYMLQSMHFRQGFLQSQQWNDAYFGVFQRDGIACIAA